MKKMRRFAAIAAAAAMTACMAVPMMAVMPASAEGSISISNTATGHVYEAYQIFDGTLTDGILTEVVWGAGIEDGAAALTAVKAIKLTDGTEPFANCADASAVAKVLGGDGIDPLDVEITKAFAEAVGAHLGDPQGTTTDTYAITGLDDGYYLVQDADGSLDGADDAYTRYIVRVLGTAENIAPKSSTPSVIKKVKEDDKPVTATGQEFAGDDNFDVGAGYNDVADYCIGEAVPFKLYGTMPSTLADYNSYYYCFNDTLGTEFDMPTSVTVKVGSATITESDGNCRIDIDATNHTITVSFEDIKKYGVTTDSIVTVEYNAVLNSTAAIGQPGQENKVDLTYSNNPNEDYKPDTTDTTEDTPDDNGQTPEDKVIVFTYELDVTKVDGTNNTIKLKDAVFTLQNAKNEYAVVADGRLTGWTTDKAAATPLTTDAAGLIKVAGLDDGEYTLTEVTPPATYNPLEKPLTLKITATTANDQEWDDFTASKAMTGIKVNDGTTETAGTNGVVNVTVANNKGASLPGTGGIGTTIFYVVGGTLVAGAGVTLIAKKRMKKED